MRGGRSSVRREEPPLSGESSEVADVPQRQEPAEANRSSGNDAPEVCLGECFRLIKLGGDPEAGLGLARGITFFIWP